MKNKLFLSVVVSSFVLNLGASDIVTNNNDVFNQGITCTSTTPIASTSNSPITTSKAPSIEVIKFSDITDFTKKIDNADKKELIMTGAELKANKVNLENLLRANPDLLVALDVSTGGFIDAYGVLDLSCDKVIFCKMESGDLPSNIKHLKITGAEKATSIGDDFLAKSNLASLDLSGLSNITSIGDFFLAWCANLASLDLSGLSNVTSIWGFFLEGCANLASLDLSRAKEFSYMFLTKLKGVINEYSLNNIPLLNFGENPSNEVKNKLIKPISKDFRESNNPNLQKVGAELYVKYLYKPDPALEKKLARLNLEKLENIAPKTLKDLPEISANQVIKFSDMIDYKTKIKNAYKKELIITGAELKANKDNLEKLLKANPDLLVALDVSTGGFINNNGVLKLSSYGLPSNIKNLKITGAEKATSIGKSFLTRCDNLASLDLSSLSNVTSIGGFFLADSNLVSLDLSGLSNVTSIGKSFLEECYNLASLDLSPLSNVTSIGDFFLADSKLVSLDLSPLSNVTSIGDFFLNECKGLTHLDLSPLSNVTSIGNGFLKWCFKFKSIDLSSAKEFSYMFLTKLKGVINEYSLNNITLPNFGENPSDDIINNVIKPISQSLRESNNPISTRSWG